jgi:hypothetical protein
MVLEQTRVCAKDVELNHTMNHTLVITYREKELSVRYIALHSDPPDIQIISLRFHFLFLLSLLCKLRTCECCL